MNNLCECKLAGFCERHKVAKCEREFQLCQGINCTGAQSAQYWNAWEQGVAAGQAGISPVAEPKEFSAGNLVPVPRRGLGDWISSGITAITGIQPCGGCKQRAAILNHWFPTTLPPIEPVSLTAPVRHLTFHVYPVKGNGSWQWNCDRLLEHREQFNGRRIVAIATDGQTDSAETVQAYLRDLTDEFIIVKNNPNRREVETWIPMLERLEKYQSDQDVTFSCHAKGIRRPLLETDNDAIYRWTKAMYDTTLSRPEAVRKLLETQATVGSFRRYGAGTNQKGFGLWHFSGTFYWWRNRDAYRRNWRYVPQAFFGTEAWPGLLFRPDESACVACDNVGNLYDRAYWDREIEPQLRAWEKSK